MEKDRHNKKKNMLFKIAKYITYKISPKKIYQTKKTIQKNS